MRFRHEEITARSQPNGCSHFQKKLTQSCYGCRPFPGCPLKLVCTPDPDRPGSPTAVFFTGPVKKYSTDRTCNYSLHVTETVKYIYVIPDP